jgi:hypothetical protein
LKAALPITEAGIPTRLVAYQRDGCTLSIMLANFYRYGTPTS